VLFWLCVRPTAVVRPLRHMAFHKRVFAGDLLCGNSASMKATVTLISRGVISLPAKVRAELGLKTDNVLLLETTP